MMTAAKIMALTGAQLLEDPQAIADMRREFDQAMAGRSYECPLTEEMLRDPGQSDC